MCVPRQSGVRGEREKKAVRPLEYSGTLDTMEPPEDNPGGNGLRLDRSQSISSDGTTRNITVGSCRE